MDMGVAVNHCINWFDSNARSQLFKGRTMKFTLSDLGDHKIMVEVREIKSPHGYQLLRFTSKDTGAGSSKIETDEVVEFEMILTPSQIKNLKDVL